MRKIEISKELLNDMYVNNKLTTYQIAEELEVSRQTVCNKLKYYNIVVKDSKFKAGKPKLKKEKIVKLYENKELFSEKYLELKSLSLVAEFFDISLDTAFSWKNKHEIEKINGLSEKGLKQSRKGKVWADKELFIEMYSKYSLTDMAKMWGCSSANLSKWRVIHNIPVSSLSEQWDKKTKFGTKIIKNDDFDFDSYRLLYIDDNNKISKNIIAYIKLVVGKCQSCGEREVLDLHHINENPLDNRPENHAILCPNCHAKIHRLGKTVNELCNNFKSWKDCYAEAK